MNVECGEFVPGKGRKVWSREVMDGGGGAAARHVGPPRTLNVQQFAAARASEVQVLYNALKAQQEEGKLSLTTPRHLRRRTASHNRRLPFRFRSNAAQAGKKTKNVKKGSDEGSLEPSSLPQGNVGPIAEEESSRKRKPEKKIPSRRVRRRIELQGLRDGSISSMRDGTRRLATHVWHAKRFPMTKTWGYCLPQGLPGRGRGSKAVYKWVKEAAVLHDASYIGVIELQGTEDAILQIISQTLERPPGPIKSGSLGKKGEMHGLLYGNAVLHNFGKAPREAIAPVTVLWRPPSSSEGVGTSEIVTAEEGAGKQRQLWIWVHPGALDNAFLSLSTACERQGLDDRQSAVKCRHRRGDLARLDIFGSRALQVLRKVLRPIPRKLAHLSCSTDIARVSDKDGNTDMTTTTSADVSQPKSAKIFAKADCLPAAAVLALDVYDPRDTPRSFYSGTNTNLSESVLDSIDDKDLPVDSQFSSNHLIEQEAGFQDKKPLVNSIDDIDLIPWENLVEKGLSGEVSDSPYLWSPPPERKVGALSQKAFSEKRHKSRKAYLACVDTLHANLKDGALDSRLEKSGACPVLLLKHAHSRASASGWSVIVPITWVQAIWVPLVFAGGRVIGLRERHWLATDAGLPYFPHDFPDCPTHAQHLAIESAAFNSANQARPPSKRSPGFPVSPLQRSIMHAYRDHKLNGSGNTSAVASELIDEQHGGQSMEVKCTDVDGDTAMTEPGSSVVRVASPPVSLIVASGFRNVDGDTDSAATGNKVSSSPVSNEGFEIVREGSSPKPNSPLAEDSASLIESLSDTVPSLEVELPGIGGEILPEFASAKGDTPVIATGTMVSDSLLSPASCQIMDGDRIPELTVPLGNSALNVGSPFVQSLVSEVTNLHGDLEIVATDTAVSLSPFSETVCKPGEGVNFEQMTNAHGDHATKVDDVPQHVISSSVASQLEHPVLNANERDQITSGRFRCEDRPSEEMMGSLPSDMDNLEVPGVLGTGTDSGRTESPILLPSCPGDHTFLGLNPSMVSSTADSPRPIFVSRTVEALMKTFSGTDLQNALLLCSGFVNSRNVQHGLRKGKLEWRASHVLEQTSSCRSDIKRHAMAGGHGKGYVRVLIVVPRKGVLKENGLLCSPTKDDFDAFLSRSQLWQGVETSWPNPQSKELKKSKGKKKDKGKRKGEGEAANSPTFQSNTETGDLANGAAATYLDAGLEQCCSREAIGCITSTGPQGSSWSGIGVCEVSALMKLRAMQWKDQRWWNKKEIVVLAGNRLSPILRPVLVSIVLETGPEQDMIGL